MPLTIKLKRSISYKIASKLPYSSSLHGAYRGCIAVESTGAIVTDGISLLHTKELFEHVEKPPIGVYDASVFAKTGSFLPSETKFPSWQKILPDKSPSHILHIKMWEWVKDLKKRAFLKIEIGTDKPIPILVAKHETVEKGDNLIIDLHKFRFFAGQSIFISIFDTDFSIATPTHPTGHINLAESCVQDWMYCNVNIKLDKDARFDDPRMLTHNLEWV